MLVPADGQAEQSHARRAGIHEKAEAERTHRRFKRGRGRASRARGQAGQAIANAQEAVEQLADDQLGGTSGGRAGDSGPRAGWPSARTKGSSTSAGELAERDAKGRRVTTKKGGRYHQEDVVST
eukprot:CAMPEP_0179995836 /NCGR_PEP_ID=MMETSP0984-20121128/7291_1 /TAXON_ID=483367 /ORGANISM="non described non described, Strain CCMP 2436" /LENGTH=123 /DNA_ID=CAMNT_0021915341 /DNA_START=64 /DNA_END=436 /DNA_ORIENTATION=-